NSNPWHRDIFPSECENEWCWYQHNHCSSSGGSVLIVDTKLYPFTELRVQDLHVIVLWRCL
ncbi:MAG: hypothetical protein KAW47_06100, partial [Thermoplasmatales archaeon]|nr:hypothetical protein [Thermoplasmatales archaeon]